MVINKSSYAGIDGVKCICLEGYIIIYLSSLPNIQLYPYLKRVNVI